ncbi:High_mobility group box domain superfamily [Hexamita inflata]|uniref:High mobility group box domain superfamily n=1 Tax=Hexamita inflata TaxID=28002 RepID=A0AA86QXK5_9EUKA|nr:High mobility group box domain superfamily [Hexamita inflata]
MIQFKPQKPKTSYQTFQQDFKHTIEYVSSRSKKFSELWNQQSQELKQKYQQEYDELIKIYQKQLAIYYLRYPEQLIIEKQLKQQLKIQPKFDLCKRIIIYESIVISEYISKGEVNLSANDLQTIQKQFEQLDQDSLSALDMFDFDKYKGQLMKLQEYKNK